MFESLFNTDFQKSKMDTGDFEPAKGECIINDIFKLPIEYLPADIKYTLSRDIIRDLEMRKPAQCADTKTPGLGVYSHLFDIKTTGNTFTEQILDKISTTYTTDKQYINDTKAIINAKPCTEWQGETDQDILEVWKDLKDDENFLERYNYMEWEYLEQWNNSTIFLLLYALMNIVSPILTLLVPILLFIMPAILMVLFAESMTFDAYYQYLKELSRGHFIGNIVGFMESTDGITWEKSLSIIGTFVLYGVSIYQNVMGGFHFYQNMKRMNDHLVYLREYLTTTKARMEHFMGCCRDATTYIPFCNELRAQGIVVDDMLKEVRDVRGFALDFRKCGELGNLLCAFYKFHHSSVFEKTLKYTAGFNAYYNCMSRIVGGVESGRLGMCEVVDDVKVAEITGQYYGSLGENSTLNDLQMKRSIILTGANGSGKSTLMKSTAINYILSQQFGVGFYQSCKFIPFEHFHVYINVIDNITTHDSLFVAQSRRSKGIMDAVKKGGRHFCILDEIFCGTEAKSCKDACVAFLKDIMKNTECKFIISTHVIEICDEFTKNKGVCNMKTIVNETAEGDLVNTYKIERGISTVRGAISVFKKLNFSQDFIDSMK